MFAKDTIFVSCEFLNCISELQNSIKHRPQINTSVLLIPVLLLSWLQIALQASPRVQMRAGHGRIKPGEVAASSRGRRLCLQTCKGHWQWTRKIRHHEQLWWNSDHFTEQSSRIAGGFNRLSLVMQSHRRGLLSRRGSWLLGLVMVTKDLLGEYYFLLSSLGETSFGRAWSVHLFSFLAYSFSFHMLRMISELGIIGIERVQRSSLPSFRLFLSGQLDEWPFELARLMRNKGQQIAVVSPCQGFAWASGIMFGPQESDQVTKGWKTWILSYYKADMVHVYIIFTILLLPATQLRRAGSLQTLVLHQMLIYSYYRQGPLKRI